MHKLRSFLHLSLIRSAISTRHRRCSQAAASRPPSVRASVREGEDEKQGRDARHNPIIESCDLRRNIRRSNERGDAANARML